MAPEAASGKLYHDKFVDIYSDHLCIKSYYFPFGKEKRIEIPFNNNGELSFTTDRDLGFTLLDWKAWGSSVNKVWWALDWTRRPLGSQLRGPPSGWMGNAPSPWPVHPGPPPAGYPPPRPPESWRGPYAAGPPPSHPPPQPRKGQRLERNENGGVSIVVMQVPPGVNKMDVLNEYFGRFGPVSSLQINQVRHEAIVTFSRMEDAEEALRYPVLNDPSIGLR
eukprot:s4598_g6.t1